MVSSASVIIPCSSLRDFRSTEAFGLEDLPQAMFSKQTPRILVLLVVRPRVSQKCEEVVSVKLLRTHRPHKRAKGETRTVTDERGRPTRTG